MIIVFEGVEGSGKTTQSMILASRIGGIVLKENILPTDSLETIMNKRMKLVNDKLMPALENRYNVPIIYDRFLHSTIAHQGYLEGESVSDIVKLHEKYTHSVKPDMVFYLKVRVRTAAVRIALRDRANKKNKVMSNYSLEERIDAFSDAVKKFSSNVITIEADSNNKFMIAHRIFKEYYQKYGRLTNGCVVGEDIIY